MEDMSKYEAEVKRIRGEYGMGAEIPSAANLTMNMVGSGLGSGLRGPGAPLPLSPVEDRVAELCRLLTKAGQTLAVARSRDAEARHFRKTSEAVFIELSEKLMQVIHECREGTPEGAPYPR